MYVELPAIVAACIISAAIPTFVAILLVDSFKDRTIKALKREACLLGYARWDYNKKGKRFFTWMKGEEELLSEESYY